jgi:hypothetical protein
MVLFSKRDILAWLGFEIQEEPVQPAPVVRSETIVVKAPMTKRPARAGT